MTEIHHIGPFILGKTLGTGTTGKVKLAFHKHTGAKVAIKIIKKDFLAARASVMKKVEREIAVMKVLQHDHVLSLYDVYETSKYLFLVLEYVQGGELFDYLVKRGRLDSSEARIFFRQIIEGIHYCHSHLICHRDLKPENLLLGLDKRIKIADFGMASLMKQGNLLSTSCGSPHYASPEVVMGLKYDGRKADVWSCGVILFALLTGKLPFDDDNIRRLLGKVRSGIFSMPQFLPFEVKELIWGMLNTDPNKRLSLDDVLRHNWVTKYDLGVVPTCVPVLQQAAEAVDDLSTLDREIVQSLQSLGWGNTEYIVAELMSPEPRPVQVFYRLLLQRKQTGVPSSPLRGPDPVPVGRLRGMSAPVYPNPSISSYSAYNQPNFLNQNVTSREPPPTLQNFVDKSNLMNDSMDTDAPQASNMISSTPLSIPNANRRRVVVTGSMPNNYGGNADVYQMDPMLSSSPTPIIGSSPKRSWFTNFFHGQQNQQRKSHSIVIANSTPENTFTQLQNAMNSVGAQLQRRNDSSFRCEFDRQINGMRVATSFIIEMQTSSSNRYDSMDVEATSMGNTMNGATYDYTLTFFRESGNHNDYEQVVDAVQKEILG